MAVDADPTEADPDESPEPTEAMTQAAGPQALAHAPSRSTRDSLQAMGSHGSHAGKPATQNTTGRPPITAADALDRSDLPRMRAFHWFGIAAPLAAVGLSFMLGGDPLARALFWAGAVTLAVCNVGLLVLTSRINARYDSKWIGVLWWVSTTSVQPAMYYFGPYSGVVMVDVLGIVFIALGRSRWTALGTALICIVSHLALSTAIITGAIADVGILSSRVADTGQLVVAELLVVMFLVAGYLLGRWARRASSTALAELNSAMRLIGDQQQVLAEHADAARVQRANEGRWTGHEMGRFKLGLVLGRGAMGEVYEAVWSDPAGAGSTDGATSVAAVKLLNARATGSASLVERFHREMVVAARLVSPHIVKVFELSPPDAPVPYIAMERLHGIDLAARLRTDPRLPSDELVQLLDQVARGLEVARKAGVVHRDLKPHNLFLHESPGSAGARSAAERRRGGSIDAATWKILDFGVSKLVDGEGTLTGDGIVGTPQYMAPEQARGDQVSHLADVYALGAIAYRCLTGRSPFKGKDLAELIYQVVHRPPQRPGTFGRVSGAIEDVLAVAMAKDPAKRFESALEFAQAFAMARRGRAAGIAPPLDAWSG